MTLLVLRVGRCITPESSRKSPDVKVRNTKNNVRFILPPFYDLYSIGFVSRITWAVETNITVPAMASMICPTTVCISV